MTYENNSCPVCGQIFSAEDDVVFCPDCGTPHHRECWKQNGACAFADKHAEGYVWQSTAQPEEPEQARQPEGMTCPRCGAECASNALVCPECGNRFGVIPGSYNYNDDYFLRGVEGDPDADLGGMTVRDAAVFVQHRAPAYVRKFTRQKDGDKKVGWNWAAFFLSPFWFFYRKIYKAGLLFLGILLVLNVFTAIPMQKVQQKYMDEVSALIPIDDSTTTDQLREALGALDAAGQKKLVQALLPYVRAQAGFWAITLIPNLFAAVFADYLYRKKVAKDVQSMHEFAQNEQTFKLLALRRGGVTIFGAIGCYCIFDLFLNFILYLS